MNIFIGCGSEIVDDKFYKNSISLVEKISRIPGVNLVFGGYRHGMMGTCYDLFKNHNKKVTAVTLNVYKEQLNEMDCNESHLVETSMDRTREIYEKSDVILFLPGGVGTYTEIMACIEESRTKEDNKMIIIYNDEFFYTPLIKEMYWLYEKKFVSKSIGEYCRIESVEEEIVKIIEKENEKWKN